MTEDRQFALTPELTAILAFGVMTVAFLFSLQDGMGDMRERMARVETRLTQIETRLTQVETRLTQVETRLTRIETRLTQIEARLTRIETRLTDMDARLESLFQEHFGSRLSSGVVQRIRLAGFPDAGRPRGGLGDFPFAPV